MEKRDKTFIWPSLVAKLVAGESQCVWAAWLKSNFSYNKLPSDFNLAMWNVKHTALLRSRCDAMEKLGFKVLIEDQNSFKWDYSATAVVSGKPDLIIFNNNRSIIEDIKSGKPKTSDQIQVMFYQIVLPRAVPEYDNTEFDGTVIYKEGVNNISIPSSAAQDQSLKDEIGKTLNLLAGDESGCRRVASHNECKWCDISECTARIK